MYYVVVINETGVPGRMYGPMTWDCATEKLQSLVLTELDRDLNEDEVNAIDMDGKFEFSDVGLGAGGVYIIMAEEN